MFKKNDPLVDAVKSVMKESDMDRQAETAVNEMFGVVSRKQIPHEMLAQYDAALNEAKKCMYEGKPLIGGQHKLDVANEKGENKPDGKLTAADFKKLRSSKGKKKGLEEKWHEESNVAPGKKPITTPAKGAKPAGKLDKKGAAAIFEKLTKGMSAGDVIHDFVHSDNPKFKGKSTKERQKMALGAYYKMHPKESKKQVSEQAIWEEIKSNLEEQLLSVYESGDEQAFADFVSSLNEDQLSILGLNESTTLTEEHVAYLAETFNEYFVNEDYEGFSTWYDTLTEAEKSALSKTISGYGDRASAFATHVGGQLSKGWNAALGYANKAGQKISGAVGADPLEASFKKGAETRFDQAAKAEKSADVSAEKQIRAGVNRGELSQSRVGGYVQGPLGGGGGGAQKPATQPQSSPKGWTGTAPKSASTNDITRNALGAMSESVKPQIKESFEQFLRNKFLKG